MERGGVYTITGQCIEQCQVVGLADPGDGRTGACRRGNIIIPPWVQPLHPQEDFLRRTLPVQANHGFRIPDGTYTLVSEWRRYQWAICRRIGPDLLEKVSVVTGVGWSSSERQGWGWGDRPAENQLR